MAKKKKKSDDKPSTSPTASEPPKKAADKPSTEPVDVAFAAGNYSAVRYLAASGNEHAQKLAALTKIDMGQIAAGIVAFIVVTTVMFFTLHGH